MCLWNTTSLAVGVYTRWDFHRPCPFPSAVWTPGPQALLVLGASLLQRGRQRDRVSERAALSGPDPVVVSSTECVKGTVGTLLLENPPGQNGLTHQGLLYETAKVFGLRSRKLKLFLNEAQTHGEMTPHTTAALSC